MLNQECVIGRQTVIGREGEHHARRLRFPIGAYLQRWPGTTPCLLLRRPGDAQPYVAQSEMEDGALCWSVTRYDTQRRGMGMLWIAFLSGGEEGGVVGLSEPTPVCIKPGPGLIAQDAPKEEQPPWLLRVTELLAGMPEQIDAAVRSALESAKESGEFRGEQGPVGLMGRPGLPGPAGQPGRDGDTPRVTLTRHEGGLYVSVMTGEEGESQMILDGVSPKVALLRDQDGVTIRVTDAEGTREAKVYDGKSVVIDESGGEGSGTGSGTGTSGGGLIWALPGDISGDAGEMIMAAAYADREMTAMLDYAAGSAMLQAGARVVLCDEAEGMCIYTTPSMFQLMDDVNAAMCVVFAGESVQVLLVFSDTVMG